MDRRTVLAFALIFLVYIAWSQVYKGLYGGGGEAVAPADSLVSAERIPGEPASASGDMTTGPDDSGEPQVEWMSTTDADVEPPPADPLAIRDPGGEPGVASVRTPLYELGISTLGARIVSWKGLAFEHPEAKNAITYVF